MTEKDEQFSSDFSHGMNHSQVMAWLCHLELLKRGLICCFSLIWGTELLIVAIYVEEEKSRGLDYRTKSHSVVSDSCNPWTLAHQASPSMGFSRQEYWSGLPFPSPRDLPDPGIKPRSPALQADALTSEPPGKPEV